jgi:serine/threonine protein phosphatase 1
MQTLVIGDIHGCYDKLHALLDKAALTEGDAIVSVGDCVDRGPDTPAVLAFFQKTPDAILIMGNHERKHVRAGRHEVKLAQSQMISRVQFGETYPDALAFMSTLPLYLDLPDALVVHGYVEPGLPLLQQRSTVLCGTMGGDKHLRTAYDRPWYELYDGEKPLLVGHHNYSDTDQPFVYRDRVFGLDTDCVTGRMLTGLLLPSFKFVSVPSRTNQWAQVRQRYSEETKASHKQTIAAVAWNDIDEKTLFHLFGKVEEKANAIMLDLRAEPGFDDLSVRKQAKRFSAKAGNGAYAALLHLARLNQLNNTTARKLLKSPENLYAILHNILNA